MRSRWIGSENTMKRELNVYNPATGDLAGTLPMLDESEFQKILFKAGQAKQNWAKSSIYERSTRMYRVMELLLDNAEELAVLLTKEMGKPILQARDEISSSIEIMRSFIERANHLYGEVLNADNQPGYEKDLIFTRREPLGLIACIIPFNYPIKLFTHKVVPALLMGNIVLVKAPSDNPLTIMRVGQLLNQAGFPEGVIQCFTCRRELSTKYLIENPAVSAVSLTGSTRVGIQMLKVGAETMKHMFMELGGNDGTIVRADADIDFAVAEITKGRMINAGQTCCACKRILVHKSRKEEFLTKLKTRVTALQVGDPMDETVDVGTVISEQAAIEIERQINFTVEQGAICAAGGKRNGAFIEPTILDQVTKDMDIASDMEVFGPVIPVITFDTDEEALEIINQSSFGLSSGIITNNIQKALQMGQCIEAGAVVLNGQGNYRHTEQGFGGVKMTGHSREGVSATLEEYSRVKHYIMRNVM